MDGISDSMDVNLSKLWETEDREAWHAAVHGFAISLDKTEQRNNWQWPEFYHCFGHERAALPRKLEKQDLSQWLKDSQLRSLAVCHGHAEYSAHFGSLRKTSLWPPYPFYLHFVFTVWMPRKSS